MKKIPYIILVMLITISLFGCGKTIVSSEEVVTSETYDFEYKFKEEYSDKIDPSFGAGFIDMIKDVVEIYETSLDTFEITEIEEKYHGYASTAYTMMDISKEKMNEEQQEIIEVMAGLAFNPNSLHLLKLYYAEDEKTKSMGLKPKYTDEYYKETLEESREWLEKPLDMAKKFIY